MLLGDIDKNPPRLDTEEAASHYFKIADKLAAILPDSYSVQDVADYVSLPEGACLTNKDKAEKQALENFKKIQDKKKEILSVKKIVDTGFLLGILGFLKEALFRLDGNIFTLIFIAIISAVGLVYFDIVSNE